MNREEENLSEKRSGEFAGSRQKMVDTQLRSRGITNPEILRAFTEVPRHLFVPPDRVHEAYDDYPLPIGCGQTISQPYVVALMLQELNPQRDHRVLEIGSGCGYQTALLGRLVKWVFAIERIEELSDNATRTLSAQNITNVTLSVGDGSMGWAAESPFDRIICGAATPQIPPSWTDQLADGGRILSPVGGQDDQMLVAADKIAGELHIRDICAVRFVKLIGQAGWPEQ